MFQKNQQPIVSMSALTKVTLFFIQAGETNGRTGERMDRRTDGTDGQDIYNIEKVSWSMTSKDL